MVVDALFVRVCYVKRVVLSHSFEISKSIVSFVFEIGILHGIIVGVALLQTA